MTLEQYISTSAGQDSVGNLQYLMSQNGEHIYGPRSFAVGQKPFLLSLGDHEYSMEADMIDSNGKRTWLPNAEVFDARVERSINQAFYPGILHGAGVGLVLALSYRAMVGRFY